MEHLIRDPVDYWILESVLEFRRMLGSMGGSKRGMQEDVGWIPPSYEQREIVKRLLRLFEAGVLAASSDDEPEIAVTRDVILGAFHEDNESCRLPVEERWRYWDRSDLIFFGLSHYGGKVWEQIVQPDWDRFVSDWNSTLHFDEDTHEERVDVHLEARTRGIAEIYMSHLDVKGRQIIPGTVTESIHRPWEATYWKTLSEGYEIHCEAWAHFCWKEPSERYLDMFHRWYTVPDELRSLTFHPPFYL